MTPEAHRQLNDIFSKALELASEERPAFLREASGGDAALLEEVLALLESDSVLEGFRGSTSETTICGFPLTHPAKKQVEAPRPVSIGPYRIADVIGEGGMGIVYLAEQTEPVRRLVALKVFKSVAGSGLAARFEAERQALALMSHTNIARVYDAGTTGEGRPYFALELVPGDRITDYCDGSNLSLRARLELFIPVCDAIQHAHQKGIIHRDISAGNVLVAEEDGRPVPKIIDFGIAKALNYDLTENALHTEQGVIMGTLGYMSPEQAAGEVENIDTRTDIYSLGVLLYELLAGVLPFDLDSLRGHLQEQRRLIREVDPPRLSSRLAKLTAGAEAIAARRGLDKPSLARRLRGDLEWILAKAMEKDPRRRYSSASELSADIRRHLDDEPVSAGPPSAAYRLRKLARKYRLALVSVAAVSLLLVAMAIATWYLVSRNQLIQQIQSSRDHCLRGEEHWESYSRFTKDLANLKSKWLESRKNLEDWLPAWERSAEFEAWSKFSRALDEAGVRFSDAMLSFHRSIEAAPHGSDEESKARRRLAELYWEKYEEVSRLGSERLPPGYYRSMADSLGIDTGARELEGRRRVSFRSDPPGAEVFCFRYVEIEDEARLVPLPFNASQAARGAAAGLGASRRPLVVEKVLAAELSPFQAGDRLILFNGNGIATEGDFAKALSSLKTSETVTVVVERDGSQKEFSWIPFPGQTVRIASIGDLFGFFFAGCPLELSPWNLTGKTEQQEALTFDLPKGSYLLVLRKEGFANARVPVAIPTEHELHSVRLLRREEIPDRFVYVPKGWTWVGLPDDANQEYLQNLDPRMVDVESFFIGRHEVTIREYAQFLNDPEVSARIDNNGEAVPAAEEVIRYTQSLKGKRVPITPYLKGAEGTNWIKEDGIWRPPENEQWKLENPVNTLSQLAALEYAHWLSEKSDRWRFRLPTDQEWEKAARGIDRRLYVWGNYLVWTYCNSRPSWHGSDLHLNPVGTSPVDESVYGVRDLTGSVEEHTSGCTVEGVGHKFAAIRGGSWATVDAYRFLIPTRLGRLPHGRPGRGSGIRLVAEPKLRIPENR